MEDLTNTVLLNNFELKEKKPPGQISDVYRAFDRKRGVDVAVKVLRRDFVNNRDFIHYFAHEAELMAELKHPNIVRLYDFIHKKNLVLIVMDWVNGSNLRDIIRGRRKPFSLKETASILEPVCSALNYAHLMETIHCDIKPTNILRDVNQLVLLTDFGIARRVSQQMTGGTPPYMAPEQFAGRAITAQTDIYALGVTTFELLSGGKVPFTGQTSQTRGTTLRDRIYWEVMHLPYPPLNKYNRSVPSAVDALIKRALSRRPQDRPISALAFLEQFENTSGSRRRNGLDDRTMRPEPGPVPSPEPVEERPEKPRGRAIRGAHLVGIAGYWEGQKIPITKKEFTIGRHSLKILNLPDRAVSRNHATVLAAQNGFFIQDDDSKAGTFVNGTPVSGPYQLQNGDVIQIGMTDKFEFWQ